MGRVIWVSKRICFRTSLVAQLVKNPPAVWETWVRSLGWEDPLGKGMVTHCSILTWRIAWTEDLVGYPVHGGLKELDMTERQHFLLFTPGCRSLPFSTLNISCYTLWSAKFLQKNNFIAL